MRSGDGLDEGRGVGGGRTESNCSGTRRLRDVRIEACLPKYLSHLRDDRL